MTRETRWGEGRWGVPTVRKPDRRLTWHARHRVGSGAGVYLQRWNLTDAWARRPWSTSTALRQVDQTGPGCAVGRTVFFLWGLPSNSPSLKPHHEKMSDRLYPRTMYKIPRNYFTTIKVTKVRKDWATITPEKIPGRCGNRPTGPWMGGLETDLGETGISESVDFRSS